MIVEDAEELSKFLAISCNNLEPQSSGCTFCTDFKAEDKSWKCLIVTKAPTSERQLNRQFLTEAIFEIEKKAKRENNKAQQETINILMC